MILHKIKIHNFKSIYGDFELDFSDTKGFWKIEGAVGSGKTTIGEAVIFGLFGDVKGKNNRDLISWGEKKASIYIECTSKGHYLKITREIGGELKVIVDDEPLIFTNKRDAQQQLAEEYYDISKMTLELLCIISFNNFKSLSNMTPADTRAFLDNVFGFSALTMFSDYCKQYRKDISDELTKTQYELNSVKSQIKKIQDLASIERINGDITETKASISEIKSKIANTKNAYNEVISTIKKDMRTKQDELAKIRVLGANKAKEIKFIEQGTCPTCGAPIDQSQLDIKKQEREVFLQQFKDVDNQIKILSETLNHKNTELDNALSVLERDNNRYTVLLTKLEEQEKRNKINIKEIEELQHTQQRIEQNITALQKDEEEWQQLYDILSNDIRQKVLSSFIPLLNKYIQEYTVQLNLPYIIEFDNAFKCTINIFGIDRPINIASLSTGQLKTVDMCIILGVLKVIFSGVNFNISFFDELFSNLDAELRAAVCNILKSELKPEQTLFIISHQELSDTFFDGSINAKLAYNNGTEKSVYIIQKYSK